MLDLFDIILKNVLQPMYFSPARDDIFVHIAQPYYLASVNPSNQAAWC